MASFKITSLSDESSDDNADVKPSVSFYKQRMPIKSASESDGHKKRSWKSEGSTDGGSSSGSSGVPPKKRSLDDSGSSFYNPSQKGSSHFSPSKKRPVPQSSLPTTASSKGGHYNDVAKKMMASMGYQEGLGLGKYGQGRTDIVEASNQKGRRGLGVKIPGLDPSRDVTWDLAEEEAIITETAYWLPECPNPVPKIEVLRRMTREGPKKRFIGDEDHFCDPSILKGVLSAKNIFDELEEDELMKARTRSNPYESIRGGMFLNRAAMKMANMDAVFGFMFTEPKFEDGTPMVANNELLYFADVCAGPGGFSEYVLFRKHWEAKGFGFTLKAQNDFKLSDFYAGTPETFEPTYGVNGTEGDGDVFVSDNQRAFRRFVLETTNNQGVHFVMADGGFSVEGEENIQEILSKQLYLCQCLVALNILRKDGHFVCKLFDIFTPFSVGLVFLMYHCFKQVCIHKPVTSRPANSERYIICKWRKENINDIADYFFEVNIRLNELKGVMQTNDILEIVPLDLMKNDLEFFHYITKSNNVLGNRQISGLRKIQAFCRNSELRDDRQAEVRKQCLDYWKIPNQVRSAPQRKDPATRFGELLKGEGHGYFSLAAPNLDRTQLKKINSCYDYYCAVSGSKETTFVIGMGRSNVYKWDGKASSKWLKLDLNLEIPRDTLLYGEVVQELQGEGKGQRKSWALHIIDVLVLGEIDVRDLSYEERIAKARVFAHAIAKPSRTDYSIVRVKKIHRLDKLEEALDSFRSHQIKGGGCGPKICCVCDDNKFFVPHGILFLKITEHPWSLVFSKSRQKIYFYDPFKNKSTYDEPPKVYSSFRNTFTKRLFWSWDKGAEYYFENDVEEEDTIKKSELVKFISNKVH